MKWYAAFYHGYREDIFLGAFFERLRNKRWSRERKNAYYALPWTIKFLTLALEFPAFSLVRTWQVMTLLLALFGKWMHQMPRLSKFRHQSKVWAFAAKQSSLSSSIWLGPGFEHESESLTPSFSAAYKVDGCGLISWMISWGEFGKSVALSTCLHGKVIQLNFVCCTKKLNVSAIFKPKQAIPDRKSVV